MSSARKRLVFDTSSLVPACLNPEREPARLFRQALLTHDILASEATFAELASVLARAKFNAWRPLEQRLMWLRLFHDAVQWVPIQSSVSDCRDPKDNKFLELALDGQAAVLVSSDIHLLELNPYRGIPVLNLSEFGRLVGA